jgi:lysophospholipase L1-like esterase
MHLRCASFVLVGWWSNLRVPLLGAAFGAATLLAADLPARAADEAADERPAAAKPSASAHRSRAKRRYRVAAMGDSLTDPRSHGGKYLDVLRDRCPESRFDSYGVGGQMVNQMRRRFERDLFGPGVPRTRKGAAPPSGPKPGYTHLLLLGGINDICSDESALRTNDKIKKDLSHMYRRAREQGLEVIALTLPPWGGFKRYYNPRRGASTHDLNRWIRKQGREKKVDAVFDVFPLLSCGARDRLCRRLSWPDQVHWNKAGHRVVGEALHKALFADCR